MYQGGGNVENGINAHVNVREEASPLVPHVVYAEDLAEVGHALPSERMKRWLSDIMVDGESPHPWHTPEPGSSPVPAHIVEELGQLLAGDEIPYGVHAERGVPAAARVEELLREAEQADGVHVLECYEHAFQYVDLLPRDDVQYNIRAIFESIARSIGATRERGTFPFSFRLYVLLGTLQLKSDAPPPQTLVDALERSDFQVRSAIQDTLAVVLRMRAPEVATLAHHALTYLLAHINAGSSDVHEDLTPQLNRILDAEAPLVQNYLTHIDLHEYLQAAHQGDRPRPDVIPGFIGGNRDSMIHAFRHIHDSYEHLLAGGMVHESVLPWRSSTVRMSEDILGVYREGHVLALYRAPSPEQYASVKEREEKWVEANDPAFDHLYAALADTDADQLDDDRIFMLVPSGEGQVVLQEMANIKAPGTGRPLYAPGGPHFLKTSTVDHIEAFEQFERQLQRAHVDFYIDRTRVPFDRLHPYVTARILEHNLAYVRAHGDGGASVERIAHEDYLHALSPTEAMSPNEEVLYRLLSRLGIRTQLEKDFEIDVGTLSLWEQRALVKALHEVTRTEVPRYRELVQTFGRDGVRALVAQETDDLDTLWKVLAGGQSREEKRAILSEYGQYVAECARMRGFLCAEYGCTGDDAVRGVAERLARTHLERAGTFLRNIAAMQTAGTEDEVAREIHTLSQQDVALTLLNDSFREMKRLDPELALERLASVSIETVDNAVVRERPELLEQMEKIYRENWSVKSEEYIASKVRGLREKAADLGHMYLATYEYEGTTHVLAFASVVKGEHGTVFASALNKNPALGVGEVGRVMLERIITHESDGQTLTADTEHGSSHERIYVNRYHFVGTGMRDEGGVPLLLIERDRTLDARLQGPRMRTLEEAQATADQDEQVRVVDLYDRSTLERLFQERFMLTRIFHEGLAVCEPDPRRAGSV